MSMEISRFKIGSFDCLSINTEYHSYSVEGFFEGTPLDQVQETLRMRNEPSDQITLACGVVFVDTGANKVLVDTGLGHLSEDPGLLNRALLENGVRPEDVDAIVSTHAHGDHTGGLLDDQERLVYPNARIYTWVREWDFWLSDPLAAQIWGQETVDRTRRMYRVIEPVVSFVKPGSEILPGTEFLPGILAVDAHGHTPGHLAVQFTSRGEILLCISDMLFHPLQLEHPGWLPEPRFMIEPQAYIESKQRLLDLAAENGALVHAMHFAPAPSLGRVIKKGEAWKWQPI